MILAYILDWISRSLALKKEFTDKNEAMIRVAIVFVPARRRQTFCALFADLFGKKNARNCTILRLDNKFIFINQM